VASGLLPDGAWQGEIGLPNEPRIAIVDDDEAIREATKDLVTALGFRAEAFESAMEFLKSDGWRDTSCLITDVHMPQMSGIELHRQLLASGASIPTILITAYPDDEAWGRALAAGAVCYLVKPFTTDKLLACIRSALDRDHPGSGNRAAPREQS
jgi:FixJ family two-component response regulator